MTANNRISFTHPLEGLESLFLLQNPSNCYAVSRGLPVHALHGMQHAVLARASFCSCRRCRLDAKRNAPCSSTPQFHELSPTSYFSCWLRLHGICERPCNRIRAKGRASGPAARLWAKVSGKPVNIPPLLLRFRRTNCNCSAARCSFGCSGQVEKRKLAPQTDNPRLLLLT